MTEAEAIAFVESKWGKFGHPQYVPSGIRKEFASWLIHIAKESYLEGLADGYVLKQEQSTGSDGRTEQMDVNL